MFKEDHLSFRQRKYMKVKNIIGRALGGIGLVVLSPVYLAIIVAIKKEDGITAPVFFSQKIKKRFRREVIGNVSISIHELLAVARESEGVKAVQGDDILCEKRFAPDTRYMVEFLVLKQTEKFGEAGIYHRYFLTKKAYYEMVELQNRGILRFQRLALVLEGTLHYLPVQTFFRDRE